METLSVIYSTVDGIEEAEKMALGLVERGLVACVNLSPEVTSVYMWEGEAHKSKEVLMMMKVRFDVNVNKYIIMSYIIYHNTFYRCKMYIM